eukprot:1140512-Pelagomonas_calceolata.AAC.2
MLTPSLCSLLRFPCSVPPRPELLSELPKLPVAVPGSVLVVARRGGGRAMKDATGENPCAWVGGNRCNGMGFDAAKFVRFDKAGRRCAQGLHL